MGHLSRKPNSNDQLVLEKENKWIEENELVDTTALLLWGKAERCISCKRPIRIKYLENSLCPDCR